MEDLLKRKNYANKIAKELVDHYESEKRAASKGQKRSRENIVFAISGKWGEGKTVLLELIENPLREKGFSVIRFNPWKYSQEDISLKRAFLQEINKELGSDINLDDLYFDRTKTTLDFRSLGLASLLRKILWASFITFAVTFIAYHLTYPNVAWLDQIINFLKEHLISFWKSDTLKAVATLLIIPVFIKAISTSKRSGNISTAEEFEHKFEEILDKKEKIVIFIDDLDRCTPKTVKVILDSLRTFFQHPECSYVVTGDHTVIERYASQELELGEEITDQEKSKEGRRFLKKLFDVYWRLPLSTPHQFKEFVEAELKKSSILAEDDQLARLRLFLVDDDFFERNPRHVKRFVTKLRFALEGIKLQLNSLQSEDIQNSTDQKKSLEEIINNPDLLAKVLLFEELFYPVYEKLTIHPEALISHEKLLRKKTDPVSLKIEEAAIGSLLGNSFELNKYASLVSQYPKFTDENDSTIHEVANYFYFSGSTGLPPSSGPDESKFFEYIKTGQAVTKLGKVLEVSTKEKNSALAGSTLSLFTTSVDPTEKSILLSESLKLAAISDEWAKTLDDWNEKKENLPNPDPELDRLFVIASLRKRPDLIELSEENRLWEVVESFGSDLSNEAVGELEKIAINSLPEVIGLRAIEIMLAGYKSSSLREIFKDKVTSFDTAKDYISKLKQAGIEEGEVFNILKNKAKDLLDIEKDFEVIISNKKLLKEIQLFDELREKIVESAKNSEILLQTIKHKDALELSGGELDKLSNNVIVSAKAGKITLLNDQDVALFLNKEVKSQIFGIISSAFIDKKNSLSKQKEAGEFLSKNSAFWSDVSQEDVYANLKTVNKATFQHNTDLISIKKGILTSWNYESAEKSPDDSRVD